MSSLTQVQIAPPADWQAFERASLVLWRNILGDPFVKQFGRQGQLQFGLDLTGYQNGDPNRLVGIQCKCITRPKQLDEKTVRSEVNKAAAYVPHLSEYIITTTADDDSTLDALAHALTEQFSKSGRSLIVRVMGWSSLQERIQLYAAAREAFDPSYSVGIVDIVNSTQEIADALPKIIIEGQNTSQAIAEISKKLDVLIHPQLRLIAADRSDHDELDRYRELINEGQLSAALRLIVLKRESVDPLTSPLVRSRLKALEAHCLWQLDRPTEAKKLFKEAHELAPHDKKGRASRILAELVDENFKAAHQLALQEIRHDPDNDAVVSLLLLTAGNIDGDNDPSGLISEKLQKEVTFAEGYTAYLRNKSESRSWWAYARKQLKVFPDSNFLQLAVSDSEIDEFLSTTNYSETGRVSAEWQARIQSAAVNLDKHRIRLLGPERHKNPLLPSLLCNLAFAYKLLEQHQRANVVLKEALTLFPDDPNIIERAAQSTLDWHDTELEENCLSRLALHGSQLLLRILILHSRGDWRSLKALQSSTDLSKLEGSDGALARTLTNLAVIRILPNNEQYEALELLLADASIPKEHLAAVAEHALQLGYETISEKAYEIAKSAINSRSSIAARVNFVRVAEQREDWRTVIQTLDGFIDTTIDSSELRKLARAFTNSHPVSQRTVDFFAGLPDAVKNTSAFLEMRTIVALKSGDNTSALKFVDEALRAKRFLARLLLLKYQTLRRANLLHDCEDMVAAIDTQDLVGRPENLMEMAHLLAMHGRREEALRLGYQVLMANSQSAQVELLYCGLFLNWSSPQEGDPTEPRSVSDGCWVRARDNSGQEDSFLIDSTLQPSRDCALPTDDRARAFIGLAVGDSVPVGRGPLARSVTILEIKHRYIHALHEIMRTFNDRHPNNPGLQRLTVQEGDIEPFLAMVRQRADIAARTGDMYDKQALPILLLALLTSPSPIDFFEFIERQPNGLKTCEGNAEERERANSQIKERRNQGAVLDLTALWTLLQLNALDIVQSLFGQISIPESTHAEIVELRDRAKDSLNHTGGTLSFAGGRYVLHEQSDEQKAALLAQLDAYLLTIRNLCDVRAVITPDTLNPQLQKLLEDKRVSDFLDAAFLATSEEKILLSEDKIYRQLASSNGARFTSWLQPVFSTAMTVGLLDAERYSSLVSQLSTKRHGYVSLDASTLIALARGGTSDFDAALAYIGLEFSDIKSHVGVIAEYADHAMKLSDKPLRKGLSKLVAKLVLSKPEIFDLSLAAIIIHAKDRYAICKFIRWWCSNRRYSFRKVMRRVTQVENRAAKRLQA